MRRDDEDIIEYTQRFWGPKYGREITREEAREMVHNVTAFVELLMKWAAEERTEPPSAGRRPRERPANGGGRGT